MKTLFIFLIISSLFENIYAQAIDDPLLKYYQSFGDISTISPKNTCYMFSADFTGDGRQSIFITNDLARLGPHDDYGWSVYCSLKSGGYQECKDILDAGIYGPHYIGYIDQIKHYGAVTGGKDTVTEVNSTSQPRQRLCH